MPYNTVSPNDNERFTLLLKEFRTQLNAITARNGRNYGLTVAIGAGIDKIVQTTPAVYSQYLDWINIMSYDFNGAWAAQGPANFHSHLYHDPASPGRGIETSYNLNSSVVNLLTRGVSPEKIVIGVPFYGRGWTGVPATNNGLWQSATSPAPGTYEAGIEDYKILKKAPGTLFTHPVAKQSWKYDSVSKTFWSYDTPAVIRDKVNWAKARGLRGVFSWSLEGDTSDGELTGAMAAYTGGDFPPQSAESVVTAAVTATSQPASSVRSSTVVQSSNVQSASQSATMTQHATVSQSTSQSVQATATACLQYPVTFSGPCGSGSGMRCPDGLCCSVHGFCGAGEPWCGVGKCQVGFGVCWGVASSC